MALIMNNPVENDAVNHPKHYTSSASGHECIEFSELLNFNRGNAFKYAWRAFDKHGSPLEDLKKCFWYIARERMRTQDVNESIPQCDFRGDIKKHEKTGVLCSLIFSGYMMTAENVVLEMIANLVFEMGGEGDLLEWDAEIRKILSGFGRKSVENSCEM